MNIAGIIRQNRRAKDMTQENLAEILGVSVSAVSLWESGKTMPDIALLPALCSVLSVSADTLLGIDLDRKDEEIAEILEEADKVGSRGYMEESIAILEKGLKRYPDEALLLVQLSTSLEKLDGTEAEKEANLRESVLLQEEILRGKDSEVRSATLYNICFAYQKIGEHEKAIGQAKKLPNLYKSRENIFLII